MVETTMTADWNMCCVLFNAWYRALLRSCALRLRELMSRYLTIVLNANVVGSTPRLVTPARLLVACAASRNSLATSFIFAGVGGLSAEEVCSLRSAALKSIWPCASIFAGFPWPSRIARVGSWCTATQFLNVRSGMLYCRHQLLLLILRSPVFDDSRPARSSRTATSSQMMSPRWTCTNLHSKANGFERQNLSSTSWWCTHHVFSSIIMVVDRLS